MSEEFKKEITNKKLKYSVTKLKGYNYLSSIVRQNKEDIPQKNIQKDGG